MSNEKLAHGLANTERLVDLGRQSCHCHSPIAGSGIEPGVRMDLEAWEVCKGFVI